MRRSHALGLRRLRALVRGDRRAVRAGIYRLLVPIEPWRYHELGAVAGQPFAGRVLDVGSPKLLASALGAEGRGRWTAIDLFDDEIASWRALDPALDLRVMDARALAFDDATFHACVFVSVIEHIPDDGDRRAMEEIWRVLRPGGVLHLTTNVAPGGGEVLVDRPAYGDAGPPRPDGRHFFERRYSADEVEHRLLALPWIVEERRIVVERRPLHDRFFALRPWSFPLGNALCLVASRNVREVPGIDAVPPGRHGVLSLRLRKPGGGGREAA